MREAAYSKASQPPVEHPILQQMHARTTVNSPKHSERPMSHVPLHKSKKGMVVLDFEDDYIKVSFNVSDTPSPMTAVVTQLLNRMT